MFTYYNNVREVLEMNVYTTEKIRNVVLDVYKRQIFDLAVHGRGAASITRILVEEKVPTPGWLNYERYGTDVYKRQNVNRASGRLWLTARSIFPSVPRKRTRLPETAKSIRN